ncbi:unnamed protein product [Closterium sp. NIES-53]
MFTRQPGSTLYTLTTEPPQVAASAQVSASGPVAAPCLCRLLSHQTLLWPHRLGHPSLSRLRGMHSHLLVSGLPRSLPPLPPSPALPCLPCVEGRHKGEVVDVLIPWIRAVRLQLRERFREDLLVLRMHSDRGGEFSFYLLQDFCRGEGILQSFTFPASPHRNGVAERRIGLVMEVARTSMIHAVAPHFLWPFAVRYAAHQLNLWPHVSLPETSPTLRWTGRVGDASVFRVWGSRAFVRNTSADKLSSRAIPCIFLGAACSSLVRTVRTGCRVPRPRPPPITSTHIMAIRSSSVPLRFPLPSPRASSLPDIPDPESDLARAASLAIPRLLATVVTDPSFESTAASALVAELVDFVAACRLHYGFLRRMALYAWLV